MTFFRLKKHMEQKSNLVTDHKDPSQWLFFVALLWKERQGFLKEWKQKNVGIWYDLSKLKVSL